MADELELDVNQGGGKKKLIIIVAVLVLLLGAGGAGAWFFLFAGDSKKGEGQEHAGEASTEKQELVVKPAIYMDMAPPFIVNFGPGSKVRYLQVEMQIMARQQAALDAVTQHMPVIRNNLLVLLSSQTYDELKSREGKEKLRAMMLEEMQKVIDEESHKQAGGIEAIYFTGFIMQ